MTDKPLANRTALITGASRGIGRAAALELARNGAHIVAVARTQGGLEELDDAINAEGGTATLVPLDVTDFDGIDRLAAALRQRYGKLDILVGNAGVLGALSPLDHVTPFDWDNSLKVNVTANWRLVKACLDLLKASDAGRVVFITSQLASLARAYWGSYAVSKAALDALARTLAAETVKTNVRVNLFVPGQVHTRMLTTAMPGMDMENIAKPEAVAKKIIDLCLPSMRETGRYYSYATGTFSDFQAPA
jgi:NAD(P)-dependent dehydrogenase (short-subunit alcohol dehydrogenase family)